MTGDKKILLSGIKPSGRTHIGNYFGALRQFVDLQDEYQSLIMLADLHALTTASDPTRLRDDTFHLAVDLLAIGLDPAKVIIFRQSEVAEHANLAWILSCLTTMPYLQRAHAYKDALSEMREVSVGLFGYPVLMAADILLYDTDVVPVGLDQKQHLEIARDSAEKFNRIYGATFKLPTALILPNVQTVIGLDGRKMSKSYGNAIPLFSSDEEIRELVMSIKTDSKGVEEPKDPETCNVFALHKLFSEQELGELEQRYRQGGIGYQESKQILIKNMTDFISPLRQKREVLAADRQAILQILKAGATGARDRASKKMSDIRQKVGLVI